jgi:hypothetical protein
LVIGAGLIFSFSKTITTFSVYIILVSSPAPIPDLMKALKIIGIIVGILVLGVAALMISVPSSNHIESSIIINASPASVYKQAISFKNFTTWSPWSKMDPDAKYTYDGPEQGVGAKMSWVGPEVGQGEQEIIEAEENLRVKNKLTFDGLPGNYYSELLLEPVDGGTKVTWTYDSDYTKARGMTGSLWKVMEIFIGGMLQEQYNTGLQELKKVVESHPEPETKL